MDGLLNRLDNLQVNLERHINTRTGRHLNVDVKKFIGRQDERDFDQFIKEYCRMGDSLDWDENALLRNFPQVISGEALAAYDMLAANEKDTWDHIKPAMKSKFTDVNSESLARYQLQSREQKTSESPAEFAKIIESLVAKGFPSTKGFTDAQRTSLAIDAFIKGLNYELKKVLIRRDPPGSLSEAISAAQKEQMVQNTLNH